MIGLITTLATAGSPLAGELRTAAPGLDLPGWDDFATHQGLDPLWRSAIVGSTALSPDRYNPTFVGVARHDGRIQAAIVGGYRGVRPRATPGDHGPLLLDVRMPGQGYAAPSWRTRDGLDLARRRSAMRAIEREAVSSLGTTRVVGIAYRNVTDEELPVLARRGAYVQGSHGMIATMRLPADHDGYLAMLSRNRRRSLARHALRIQERLEIDFGAGRTDVDAEAYAALLAAMAHRHKPLRVDPRAALPAEYLRLLMARPDVRTLTYRDGDRLLAAGLLLGDGPRLSGAHWAMLHPADGGVPHLYFDHLARLVRHGIATGAEQLSAGRGYVTPKITMGFSAEPLHFVAVPRPLMGRRP